MMLRLKVLRKVSWLGKASIEYAVYTILISPIGASMFSNIKSLAYYQSNNEDPYIVLPNEPENDELEMEEREELQILNTDNILLATKTEDNVSHMEVYVYEESEANLYVHHDIMLPSFPLCVEWITTRVGPTRKTMDDAGSFAAIGTFDPEIEIWNLDVVDGLYPDAILGSVSDGQASLEAGGVSSFKKSNKKKNKKKSKTLKVNDNYHIDSVLTLANNRLHKNLLASGSADKTIKLWDLNTLTCAKSYGFHTDKVCSVNWHPIEGPILLSGSYDRTIVASDMRAADSLIRRWGVESDIETVKWDKHNPNFFFASTESGKIHYFDARQAPANLSESKPVWTLQAHDSEVSTFDVNPCIPGLLVTGSIDRQVKIWKVEQNRPSLIVTRDLDVGRVFSTTWAPDQDTAFTLAVGGSKSVVQIWDTKTNGTVRQAFEKELRGLKGIISTNMKEKIIGVTEDDEDDEDEEQDTIGESEDEI